MLHRIFFDDDFKQNTDYKLNYHIYALFDLHFLKSLFLDCEEAHSDSHHLTGLWEPDGACVRRGRHRVRPVLNASCSGCCFYFGTLLIYPAPSVVRSVAIPGSEVNMKRKLSASTPNLSSIKEVWIRHLHTLQGRWENSRNNVLGCFPSANTAHCAELCSAPSAWVMERLVV